MLILATVVGCEQSAVVVPEQTFTPDAPRFQMEQAALAQDAGTRVAQALSLALGRQSVRVQLRNALRNSKWNEHKIVFQEFLKTSAGRRMAKIAADASGRSIAEMNQLIYQLPTMDMYVPFREHRLSWVPSEEVTVAATLYIDDPEAVAFNGSGAPILISSKNGLPDATLVLLHPAEPKSERPGAYDSLNNQTIQAADEPDGTVVSPMDVCMESHEKSGVPTLDYSDVETLDCEGGGGGGVWPGGFPAGELSSFVVYVNDGWGAAEVKFHHMSNGAEVWAYRQDGVDAYVWYYPDEPAPITDHVWVDELDSGLTGADDYWGMGDFALSGVATEIVGECGPVFQDGNWQASCDYQYYGEYAYHREINTAAIVYTY